MLASLKDPEKPKKEEEKKESSSSSDSESVQINVKISKAEQIKTESKIILNDEYLS